MLVKLLRSHLAKYKWLLVAVMVLQLAQTSASLYLPSLNAHIIDKGIAAGDHGYIWRTGTLMLAITLLQIMFAIAAVNLGSRAAQGFGRDVRSGLFHRVTQFSAREVGHFGPSSLITRITNDVQQVQMMVQMTCTLLVAAPMTIVGGIIMALREDTGLSWILVVSIPALVLAVTLIISRMVPQFRVMQERIDGINRVLREQITGMRVVRAFVREPDESERFAEVNETLTETSLRTGRMQAFFFPTVLIALNVSSVAAVWIGANRISKGQMTIGAMVAFLSYLAQILMSVMMASFMAVMIPRAAVCAERIQEVLETESSVVPANKPVTTVTERGSLELRHVGFHYPGADKAVLADVSFTSLAGQTTAIIGSTGSGKTTLINLIPRLADVTSGAILVDGVDVRKLQPEMLWSRIGLVPQKPYLFSGTVASNLRYGKPDATDDELWEALTVAQAADFVATMDGGLHARIAQGGSNVSGGQRQRLAIARALVLKPEIYLFDDSFSALDLATDARLRAALVPYTRDSTMIIVAQRVSTIADADQILVLEDGTPVGLGTHDDLVANCPTFAEIVASQYTSAAGQMSDTRPVPAKGGTHELEYKPPASEFRAGPGGGRFGAAGMPTERSKDFGTSVKRLLRRLRPDRLRVAAVLFLAVTSVTLTVIGPKLLGRATDVLYRGLRSGKGIDFGQLHKILLGVVVLYLCASALAYTQGYLLSGIVQRTMYRLRADVEDKLNRLPLSYVDRQPRGDLLSRVTNDIDNISQSLQQTLSQMLTSTLSVTGVMIMMLTISWVLALVAIITIPLSLYMVKWISKRSRAKFIAQWKHTGALNAQIEETFSGHNIVKAFGRQHEAEERFQVTNEELYEASYGAQFASGTIQPAMMFLGNLNFVAIAVIGGLRVSSGSMSLGDVQAFIQYSRQFTMPLTQFASMINVLQSGIASAERCFVLLDAEEQTPDPTSEILDGAPEGRVAFENVTFSYRADKPLIQDLSLVAQPGETVAIVGPTGAGKTTLVNLLMRFYELDGGRITLDGIDVSTMSRRELRSNMGMVLQDTWLFGGTIRENIAYGNLAATDQDIKRAAKATYVDRFVRALPDGYDTVLDDEGATVSAGEKQLLTIARAFLANPTILILDEATSSVDTRTEVLIQKAMNTLRKERTSFVIAHRLSTIRDADIILVMEDGQIVEQGDHDELLTHDGAYARLYNAQFAGAATDLT